MKCIIFFTLFLFCFTYSHAQQEKEVFYFKENVSPNLYEKSNIIIDSISLYKEHKGDTLIFWTNGMSTPTERKALDDIRNHPDFGFKVQLGAELSDGRTMVHRLKKMAFLIKNDTLFQLTEKYYLSKDSINNLLSFRNHSVIENNIQIEFRPIFSTSMVDINQPIQVINEKDFYCPNHFELNKIWNDGEYNYYSFHITNDCGEWSSRWGFVIREDFVFVRFGKYYNRFQKHLIKENRIY